MSINIDKSVKSPYWSAHKYFYSHVIIPTTACQNTPKVIMVIPLKGRGSILKMDHALSPLVFISFPLQPEQLYYGCVQWRVYLCDGINETSFGGPCFSDWLWFRFRLLCAVIYGNATAHFVSTSHVVAAFVVLGEVMTNTLGGTVEVLTTLFFMFKNPFFKSK